MEENITKITGQMAIEVFDRLLELHQMLHAIDVDDPLETQESIDLMLSEENPVAIKAMLVAVTGLVSRGELLVMHEMVREAVESGEYDEVISMMQEAGSEQ